MTGLQAAWAGFQDLGDGLKSSVLRGLTTAGAAADMATPLRELSEFTDWDQAAELGRVMPRAGADASFDAAEAEARCCLSSVLRNMDAHCPQVLPASASPACFPSAVSSCPMIVGRNAVLLVSHSLCWAEDMVW
jgi:hypothetical protein